MTGRILTAAVLMVVALPAAGDARPVAARYSLSGGIVISWTGAPGRCEAAAACDLHGVLTYAPVSSGEFEVSPNETSISNSGDASNVVVRVERGNGLGTCVEAAGADGSDAFNVEAGRRGLRIGLAGAFEPGVLSSGRCAGPLDSDLA